MIGWIIAGVVVVLLGLWLVSVYNGLIKLRNLVQEAWRQIDVELKRRHDLIGNLVETVKGYAAHERGTLEDVMKARSAAMAGGQSPAQQAQSEGLLSAGARPPHRRRRGLPRPQGQPELPRPAAGADLDRGPYRLGPALLQRQRPRAQHQVETVPSNIVAGMFSIGRAEYFEAEGAERDAVQRRLRPARGHHPAAERVCRGHAGRRPAAAPAAAAGRASCRDAPGPARRPAPAHRGHLTRRPAQPAFARNPRVHRSVDGESTGWGCPWPGRRLEPVGTRSSHPRHRPAQDLRHP